MNPAQAVQQTIRCTGFSGIIAAIGITAITNRPGGNWEDWCKNTKKCEVKK